MPSPTPDVASEAAVWQARLLAGRLGKAEQARLDAWLAADPAHAEQLREMQAIHAAAKNLAETPEILALRHETLARVALRRQQQRWRHAVAAGAAAVLVAGGGWLAVGRVQLASGPAHEAAAPSTLYETAAGERTTVVLPDGSVAELDARSRLRASFSPTARSLRLEQGQALFEVAKDARRPFRVEAAGQTITAHGTRFNVRLGDRRLEVALIEGKVAVTSGARPATAMAPHDLLRIDDGVLSLTRVQNIERFASWREGLIILENARLDDAVAEINRYSADQIRLSDPELAGLRLSGAFRVEQTEGFVEALEMYFGLKVVSRSAGVIVLGAR
jgi:transmembrane sensor